MEEPQIGVEHRNEDFEFAEEAYLGQEDNDEDSHPKHHQQWWASVNQACEEGVGGQDEESDGIRSESELESLYVEDEDDEQPSRRAFNPHVNLAEFKFKLVCFSQVLRF